MAVPLSLSSLFAGLGLITISTTVPGHVEMLARRHDVADQRYLDRAAQPAFRAIGAIRHDGSHHGTGTLISPEWVLTDAHVVSARDEGVTTPFPPGSITVVFDGVERTVREVVIHPDYWAARNAGERDVLARRGIDAALLRLDTPVTAMPPLPLASADPAAGSEVTFVGRGTSGDAASVIKSPVRDGRMRAGSNRVDQVGGVVGERVIPGYLLVGDFDHPSEARFNRTGTATATEYESLPIGGDSGGPILLMSNGRPSIVGLFVTSSIAIHDDPADGVYGSVWYGTSVASIRGWVESVVEGGS